MKRNLRCSFCHRGENVVTKLISSSTIPRSYICDACIAKCNSILEDHEGAPPLRQERPGVFRRLRHVIRWFYFRPFAGEPISS